MTTFKQLRSLSAGAAGRIKSAGFMVLLAMVLSSCSDSSRNNDDILDDASGIPTSPGNLLGTVYSSTDAELTWEASQDDGLIMGYEVMRDGKPTGPLLDALHYHDLELEPDTSYLYSIVAVDDQGNRSPPAEITIRTEEGPPLATINRANYTPLLAEVFDVFSGSRYRASLLNLESLALDDSIGTSTLEGHYWSKIYTCENDGRADSRRRDGLPGESLLSMHFEECELHGTVYDGDIEGTGLAFTTSGLQVRTASDEMLTLAGGVYHAPGSPETNSLRPEWNLGNTSISVTDADGTVSVSNANTQLSAGYHHSEGTDFNVTLWGEMTLESSLSSNLPIVVRTPEFLISDTRSVPFSDYGRARDWSFDTGILQLAAEDGSTLTLTPASDAAENVSITLAQGADSVTFSKPWSSWVSHLQIFPILEEPEFPSDVPAATSVIRVDNYETLVTTAFDVMTGTPYWSFISDLPWRWFGDDFEMDPDGDGWSYAIKTCGNGGTSDTQFTLWDGFSESWLAEYDNCLIDNDSAGSLDFAFDGKVKGVNRLLGQSISSDALTVVRSPDVNLQMAGWLQTSTSFTRQDNYRLRRTDKLAIHAVEADGEVFDVSNATVAWGGGWGRADTGYSADLAGHAIFRSSHTDDRRIKITIPQPFHYESHDAATEWTFPVGRLQLLADDGSELTLDAAAGEPGRVQITLNNSEGETQFEVDWAPWAEMLRP